MIIYFPMSAMIPFGELTPDQCAALRGLSTRDPKYAALAEQRMRQGKLL
jgi:hypothetical protein